ncbi:MAG TPA: HAMP domain-containing sensor histidine kinase [Cyclobacteriaceae bacterium]|nr:HAMP domain-containing sensor histidine kinase [Cyclobacteriaceae bacterium]HRX00132.1 HAMP domain-containing sensor histidine kinase [Cyclobacteriaceae bacterium]
MLEKVSRLKILFLEDAPEDAELVERALRKEGLQFDLFLADTKDEFLRAIREQSFDVILSDHSLPQFNSSEALTLCRRLGIEVPFILVTGSVSEEFAITRLKEGADDYILKTSLQRLPTAIINAVQQRRHKVDRLEAELALRTQNEELIKINQELDSFVYSVSHDLRAPLRSLLGLLNISKRDDRPRDPIYDQYFQMMEESIHKLDSTLKDILEYSRNARRELNLEKIDFNKVLSGVVSKLEYMQGFDKLNIKTRIEGEDTPFISDSHRLSVVFSNLLSNAIKYCDPQKEICQLEITVRILPDEATITFEDNGIGIHESILPKIFNMFYRGTELSEGAGLGLYIIKETLLKLRGNIDVASKFGVGTTFRVGIHNFDFGVPI